MKKATDATIIHISWRSKNAFSALKLRIVTSPNIAIASAERKRYQSMCAKRPRSPSVCRKARIIRYCTRSGAGARRACLAGNHPVVDGNDIRGVHHALPHEWLKVLKVGVCDRALPRIDTALDNRSDAAGHNVR